MAHPLLRKTGTRDDSSHHPELERGSCHVRCCPDRCQRALTTLSQTEETTMDAGSRTGRTMDYDLRQRTDRHWPDMMH